MKLGKDLVHCLRITVCKVPSLEMSEYMSLTIHRCEDDPGVVVGNNICIAVLWLVDLQVGVLPGELLSWINRLTHRGGGERQRGIYRGGREKEQVTIYYNSVCIPFCDLKPVRARSEESRPINVTQKLICHPSSSLAL